jgi:GntR family transcriptional regulator
VSSRQLDRQSAIPLYHQLAEVIKQQIRSGDYGEGDALPSEPEFIDEYGVSRTTVRLALDEIEKLGLIRREQGRGTFVTAPIVRSPNPLLSSFTQDVERLGLTPGAKLLDASEEKLPLRIAQELGLEEGQSVLRVVRLRTADDQPIAIVKAWLNVVTYPQLRQLDYNGLSVYQGFEEKLGLRILLGMQQVWADGASSDEAPLLGLSTGAPVLRLTRTTFVESDRQGGTPIEYIEAAFVNRMFRIDTRLFRHSSM